MPLGKAHSLTMKQNGFTYVWALMVVALVSVGLSVVGPLWADRAQRDREQDLLRVGRIYAQAIGDYYVATPGTIKKFPQRLEELTEDSRFWGTRRHMRRLYPDPLAPDRPWGLIRDPSGGIMGVYSQSDKKPFASVPLDLGVLNLAAADRYSDWRFVPDASQLQERLR
jgi:type II secretory pathway pseudopilin PulG